MHVKGTSSKSQTVGANTWFQDRKNVKEVTLETVIFTLMFGKQFIETNWLNEALLLQYQNSDFPAEAI
jgi:hypothetical protein